jgi:hypothetical protein
VKLSFKNGLDFQNSKLLNAMKSSKIKGVKIKGFYNKKGRI